MNELFKAEAAALFDSPAFRPMKQFVESSELIDNKFIPLLFRNLINGFRLLCVALASIINWETSEEPLTWSFPLGFDILMPTFCENVAM